MLDTMEVSQIAANVARVGFVDSYFERVVTEPSIDSVGNEALRITLVLKPKSLEVVTGNEAIDLLVEIQKALRDRNEERLAIIDYATEQEIMDAAIESEELSEEDA